LALLLVVFEVLFWSAAFLFLVNGGVVNAGGLRSLTGAQAGFLGRVKYQNLPWQDLVRQLGFGMRMMRVEESNSSAKDWWERATGGVLEEHMSSTGRLPITDQVK